MPQTHKNNFDFLRIFAATGVLFSHSYMLLDQHVSMDWLGSYCLNIFFIISGYLVTKSYISNPQKYILNRILRIYPALIVNVLVVTFILGALLSTLPFKQYFSAKETYNYLLNISAIGYSTSLPGVFKENHQTLVNGSLWTLGHELLLYICIFVIGISRLKFKLAVPVVIIILAYLKLATNYQSLAVIGDDSQILFAPDVMFALYFMTGAAFYLFVKNYNFKILLLLAITAVVIFIFASEQLAAYLLMPYAVFYFAFSDKIKLSNISNYGDFSYGMYIYAYPVQQMILVYYKNLLPLQLFACSLISTLACAVLSWHLVEKKALNLKAVEPAS